MCKFQAVVHLACGRWRGNYYAICSGLTLLSFTVNVSDIVNMPTLLILQQSLKYIKIQCMDFPQLHTPYMAQKVLRLAAIMAVCVHHWLKVLSFYWSAQIWQRELCSQWTLLLLPQEWSVLWSQLLIYFFCRSVLQRLFLYISDGSYKWMINLYRTSLSVQRTRRSPFMDWVLLQLDWGCCVCVYSRNNDLLTLFN